MANNGDRSSDNAAEEAKAAPRRRLLPASQTFAGSSSDRRPEDSLGLEPDAKVIKVKTEKTEVPDLAGPTRTTADSGAPPSSGRNVYADINYMLESELSKIVSPEVEKFIKKHTLRLYDKIDSLQTCNARLVMLRDEVEKLKTGVLPKGKAVKISFETLLLDKTTLTADDGILKEGMTIRDAKRASYIDFLLRDHLLDIKLNEAQRTELKAYCRKIAFIERCSQRHTAVRACARTLDISDDEAEDIADDGPSPSDRRLEARLTIIYNKVLDRVATTKATSERQKVAVEAQSQKVAEKLAQRTPIDWLNATIDARQRQKTNKNPKEVVDGFVVDLDKIANENDSKTADSISKALSPAKSTSIPKNGASPTASGGIIDSKGKGKKGKGKGKGKSKADGKSNGKSKGKGKQDNQKGKSKGSKSSSKGSKGGKSKGKGKGKEVWTGKGYGY